MKQFLTVFKFEFLGHLKNKMLIGVTVALVIAMALTLSYPRFEGIIKDANISLPGSKEEISNMAIKNESDIPNEVLIAAFTPAFKDKYKIVEVGQEISDSKLTEKVSKEKYDVAIIVDSQTSYRYITHTAGMYDMGETIANGVLLNIFRANTLATQGMSNEEVLDFLGQEIKCENIVTGKDQSESFLYTYAIIMILYMVLIFYGQFVSNGVATEKSSRAMEVLITSAKPINLMFGKVLGAGCAGLIQIAIIIFSAYGFYELNKGLIENEIISSIFGMPLDIALYSILFFVLGYFIYAFMYGAAGSLTTRIEDLGTITMPITVIYMLTFIVAIFGMSSGLVDETFFKVCSFLPTFAPMVMLVRICMGSVEAWEIILSVVIQMVTIVGLGFLCAKIYRAGVLMYGNTPKIREIWKILKNAETMK